MTGAEAQRWSWTQPICLRCWTEQTHRIPVQVIGAVREQCAYCGAKTRDGIYLRDDPATVRFPAVAS